MRKSFKENINILFLKDVDELLGKNEIKYFITEKDNKVIINNAPLVFLNYLSTLYDFLAYDYDELDSFYQDKYKFYFKTIKKIDNNIYEYDTKTYKKNSL